MKRFQDIFKQASTVRRKIENNRYGKKGKGSRNAPERKGDSNQGKKNRDQGADRAPADFFFANFRIFYMVGIKYIDSHPI